MTKINFYFRLFSFCVASLIGVFIPLKNYFHKNNEANFQWSMFNSSIQICQLHELGGIDDNNFYTPKENLFFYRNQPLFDRQRFVILNNKQFLFGASCRLLHEEKVRAKFRCITQNSNTWDYFEKDHICN